MDVYPNDSFNHLEPASFSFDTHPQAQPHRSISKCLKLKTNESLDDQQMSIELARQKKKGLQTQIQEIDGSRCLQLAQQEFELRTESLIKQYQLKLSKQEEYFGLKQWKLKEELQNLQTQNNLLSEELRRAKGTVKLNQNECSLCSDGKVIAHYRKIITENQQNHQGCLLQKKELSRKIHELSAKLSALEQQNQTICHQLRATNRMHRNCQSQIRQLENQVEKQVKTASDIDQSWKEKFARLQSQFRQAERQLAQRDYQLNQSKMTVTSNQAVMNKGRISLKSSVINSREEKQNDYGRGRGSLNKLTVDDRKDNQQYLKKIDENCPRNGHPSKYEPLRWKYF